MGAGQERNNMDYKSRRWKRLRKKILRRDRYCCRESKRYGQIVEATTAHHVWPVEQYPEYQWCEWNLIALSGEEHNAMHDRETGELTDKGEYWRRKITPPPPTPLGESR
jgi:5-methylcytosine-specific restriction endonuclease McrA